MCLTPPPGIRLHLSHHMGKCNSLKSKMLVVFSTGKRRRNTFLSLNYIHMKHVWCTRFSLRKVVDEDGRCLRSNEREEKTDWIEGWQQKFSPLWSRHPKDFYGSEWKVTMLEQDCVNFTIQMNSGWRNSEQNIAHSFSYVGNCHKKMLLHLYKVTNKKQKLIFFNLDGFCLLFLMVRHEHRRGAMKCPTSAKQ